MSIQRRVGAAASAGKAAATDVAAGGRCPSLSGSTCREDSSSPPRSTNVLSGRNKLQTTLRSIVMSRACYYLFHGFNPECNPKKVSFSPSDSREVPDFTTKRKDDDRDAILAGCARSSRDETTITKRIAARIDKLEALKQLAFTFAEAGGKTGETNPPRLDI